MFGRSALAHCHNTSWILDLTAFVPCQVWVPFLADAVGAGDRQTAVARDLHQDADRRVRAKRQAESVGIDNEQYKATTVRLGTKRRIVTEDGVPTGGLMCSSVRQADNALPTPKVGQL